MQKKISIYFKCCEPFLDGLYKCIGRAIALPPGVSDGSGIGGSGGGMDKMLKFYVKNFVWWARPCHASYPLRG